MPEGAFKVQIIGLDKLQATFNKAPEIIEPVMQEAISKSAAVLAHNTNPSTTPWITGTLARSFNPATIGRLFARWYPRVRYAKAVQYGMPPSPGRYVPAIGKRLKNGSNIGMWPGFKGRHYMEKILNASTKDINVIFKNALVVAVNKFKK